MAGDLVEVNEADQYSNSENTAFFQIYGRCNVPYSDSTGIAEDRYRIGRLVYT